MWVLLLGVVGRGFVVWSRDGNGNGFGFGFQRTGKLVWNHFMEDKVRIWIKVACSRSLAGLSARLWDFQVMVLNSHKICASL